MKNLEWGIKNKISPQMPDTTIQFFHKIQIRTNFHIHELRRKL